MAEILAVEAELLRSEGVNPQWPGFAPSGQAKETERTDSDRA